MAATCGGVSQGGSNRAATARALSVGQPLSGSRLPFLDPCVMPFDQHKLANLHRAHAAQVAVIQHAEMRHALLRNTQVAAGGGRSQPAFLDLSLIHISEP